MTDPALLTYYADLLITQYRVKTRARDTIKLLANQNLCDGLPQEEMSCYDLDIALGDQLTVLGKIVGIPRAVYGLDLLHTFFNFTRYDGTPASTGFGRYSDVPYGNDLWYRYNNFAIYTLTDFELRTLIRLKVIYNCYGSSFKDIKDGLWYNFHGSIDAIDSGYSANTSGYTFFNFTRYSGTPASTGFGRYTDYPYIDYWDRYSYHNIMNLTYMVNSIYQNAFTAGLFLDAIPAPMGVGITTVYN